jgi:histidinol-phosphatase (PHP family)
VIVDYHMHLRGPDGPPSAGYSADRAEEYFEHARVVGIDEIGFSDHVYYFEQAAGLWEIPWMRKRATDDLDEYAGAVEEAKSRGLPVKLGLEVDYFPGLEEDLEQLLDAYPWDYVLGSVHFVDGIAVDQQPGLVRELEVDDAWRRYFDWLRGAARSGLFDILSHPDLVKIFGVRPSDEDTRDLHVEAAAAIAEAGVCVEVSSAGLHKPVGELYPDRELLALCHERGVAITLASDAHEPAHVGRDIDRVAELAEEVGYETLTVFDARRPRQEPLG